MTEQAAEQEMVIATRSATYRQVTKSPFGEDDQIGTLNSLTEEVRARLVGEIAGGKTYDLAVEFFVGMPGYLGANDPPYQICMSHAPPRATRSAQRSAGTSQATPGT